MNKFNPFKFKAIETVYNNYRMRSRLEARWGTFFDALGIEYRYESEGFDLDGAWYLPDFFLPQFNCWVEIKGARPTEEEINKIYLLSLYSGKQVHLFYGEIGAAETNNAFTVSPPLLWKYPSSEKPSGTTAKLVRIAPDLLALRQKLEERSLQMGADKDRDITVTPCDTPWKLEEAAHYLEHLQKQPILISVLQEIASTRKEEVVAMLVPDEGWVHEFWNASIVEGTWWGECSECGAIGVYRQETRPHHCGTAKEGYFVRNSPAIMNAYAAARQARF